MYGSPKTFLNFEECAWNLLASYVHTTSLKRVFTKYDICFNNYLALLTFLLTLGTDL